MRQSLGLVAVVSTYVLCLAAFLVAAVARPAFDAFLLALGAVSVVTALLALSLVSRVALTLQRDILRSTLVVAAIALLFLAPVGFVVEVATGRELSTPLVLFGVGVVIAVWRAFFDLTEPTVPPDSPRDC